MTAFVEHLVATWGLLAVFLTMIVESCGIPISAEIVAPLGGALAAQGHISAVGVVALASVGNLIGSMIAYELSRRWGRAVVLGPGRWIGLSEAHLDLAERFFSRFGGWAVFVGRFLPVVRTYISFPAGVAGMRRLPFAVLTLLGCIPWMAALTYAGYRLGEHWEDVERLLGRLTIPIGILCVALLVVVWILGRRWVDRYGASRTPD
jgi:membrane protein DedA with SNARE-associated domain